MIACSIAKGKRGGTFSKSLKPVIEIKVYDKKSLSYLTSVEVLLGMSYRTAFTNTESQNVKHLFNVQVDSWQHIVPVMQRSQ